MSLTDALEACLRALETGATIEECVARYPELEDDLRPLLQAAEQLQDAPRATPSHAFRETTRQRILGLGRPAVESVSTDGRVVDRPVVTWLNRARQALGSLRLRPAVVGAVAALLLIILLMNTAVSVAAVSLPDSPLYPVKRAGERVQLAFTDDEWDRVQLHLRLADRRLSEAVAVPSASPALVDEYQAQLAAALSLLIELHESGTDWSKLTLLARPTLARQQTVLQSGEANRLPQPTYVAAITALDTVQSWVAQLEPAALVQAPVTPTPLPTERVVTPTREASTATTIPASPPPTPLEPTATQVTAAATEPAVVVQVPASLTPTPTSLERSVSAPVPSASPTATAPAPTSTRTATVAAPVATATATANPTVTQTATRVPPPPTATSAPPTATSTPVQPPATDTPEPYPPASETPTTEPPTATPVPPSATPVPPSSTPVPPTATATPEPYQPPPLPPSPTPLPPNDPPSLNRLSCDPCEIEAGQRAVISAEASDPDGDSLVLTWNVFPNIRGSTIQECPDRWSICYLANYDMEPGDTATITITLTVSDDAGNSASGSLQILVSGPG